MAIAYETPVALTLTAAATLGNNAAATSSAVVAPTTGNTVDALVEIDIGVGAVGATPAATVGVNVYAYASLDTTYPDGISGTSAAHTIDAEGNNLRFLGFIACQTQSTTQRSNVFSIAAAYGGIVPPQWGIVVQNVTGVALTSCSGTYSHVSY